MTQQLSFETYRGNPAANYERYFVPAIASPLARDLVELAALRPGERVVDVACGTGVVTRLAADRVGDSAVAGVDVNPGMLEVARTAAPDTAIEWHAASADALPLGDGTFDVALCQMGLQFFPDRLGALRELRRVLAPGGRVALNVPGPTPPPLAVLERALGRHLGPQAAGFVATVFSLHEPAELRELMERAGFTGVEASSEHRVLTVPPAEDFLWQYVFSTPLAEPAGRLDEERRDALQREVVTAWAPFADDGGLVLELDLTSVTARVA
jgi:ubiquinone/menaquinone biosynthesis C-methylase UbiE